MKIFKCISNKDYLKMDQILYLLHSTKQNPREWENKTLMPSKGFKSQFPGVYLTLITKNNLDTELPYPGKYYILYSVSLLQQHNYHINIHDHNGIISEYNTYYPWNLDKALTEMHSISKIKTTSNEVVFHDPIPADYIVKIIKKPPNAYMYPMKDYLPSEQLISKKKPDLTLLPYYVYPMEHIYNGIPLPYKKSSLEWLRKIARLARISIDIKHASREDIIKAIKKRMAYLYKHREKQDLILLTEVKK